MNTCIDTEINPKELLMMIGFVYAFTDKNPTIKELSDIGIKRITGFNFHINGLIEACLSDPNDFMGDDGDYYDLASLTFKDVPGGHERQMPLPFFTLPVNHRAKPSD